MGNRMGIHLRKLLTSNHSINKNEDKKDDFDKQNKTAPALPRMYTNHVSKGHACYLFNNDPEPPSHHVSLGLLSCLKLTHVWTGNSGHPGPQTLSRRGLSVHAGWSGPPRPPHMLGVGETRMESVMGWTASPEKMCQSLNPPALVDAPLFGNTVSAVVIKLQMRSLGWPRSNMTAVLPRGGGILRPTQERTTPCNRRRQRAKGCSREPREPRAAGNSSDSSKRQVKMLPSRFQKEPDPADTLISDFSLQNGEMREISLLFQAMWFVRLVSAALGNVYRQLGKLPVIPGQVMAEDTPEHNSCESPDLVHCPGLYSSEASQLSCMKVCFCSRFP